MWKGALSKQRNSGRVHSSYLRCSLWNGMHTAARTRQEDILTTTGCWYGPLTCPKGHAYRAHVIEALAVEVLTRCQATSAKAWVVTVLGRVAPEAEAVNEAADACTHFVCIQSGGVCVILAYTAIVLRRAGSLHGGPVRVLRAREHLAAPEAQSPRKGKEPPGSVPVLHNITDFPAVQAGS